MGRQAEWARLREAWEWAVNGRASFALVTGVAGIGKSRLAEELLTWAERQGVATAKTRSYAAEGRLSLAPVREWLRSDALLPQLAGLDDVWRAEVARILPELLSAQPGLVYFCFADHYEPYGGTTDQPAARSRVAEWVEKYPKIAGQHHDSEGRVPQHSFFYPQEEYDDVLLDQLAGLCRAGFGDVEVHLHHDGDTAGDLRAKLRQFVDTLHCRHGLLRRDETGQVVYAFIHGNWALDNSRPDGRWWTTSWTSSWRPDVAST